MHATRSSKATHDPEKYHLVLADGSQPDVFAYHAETDRAGTLILRGHDGEALHLYAAGAWTVCELSRKDTPQ